ncbi:hypothetical protein N2152v2_006585 [Parachlorella kessleri]
MDKLMARFKAADKDGNGVIDRQELRGLLERVGDGQEAVHLDWLTEEDVEHIYQQYDINKDGVISFEEFVAMALDNILLEGKLEEYQQAFRSADEGGNGCVGATELFHLFKRLGNPISYERLVALFDKYDIDDSGTIDFPEFLRMFKDELLDLREVLDYIKLQAAEVQEAAAAASAATVEPSSPPSEPCEAHPGEVTMIFGEEELSRVLAACPGKLVVLMCSLTWCRPCKRFQPSYEKAAEYYADDVVFLKLYGNSNDSTKHVFKDKLKCRTTPTFFFFRDRKLLGQCHGANESRLEYNLRMMLQPGQAPSELLFARYFPSGDLIED